MATLSKHGRELLRIDGLLVKIVYCADGKVLRNTGSGWKIWKKVKAGLDPVEVASKRHLSHQAWREARPCYCDFERQFKSLVPPDHRWTAWEALKSLPDDLDGLWVEFNDHIGVDCSVEDLREVVNSYHAYEWEAKELAKAAADKAPAENTLATA